MGGHLTAEQREEFLAAYRKTFTAADHGKALAGVYAHFLALFKVDPQTLRRIIRKDLAANPQLYATLRDQLTRRNSSRKATTAAKVATTPPPKNKAIPKEGAGLRCRVCGQGVGTNRNGTVAPHNAQGRKGSVPCPGAGLKVAPPKTSSPRPKAGKGQGPKPQKQGRTADPEKVRKRVQELLGTPARQPKPAAQKPSRKNESSKKSTRNQSGPTTSKCPNCLKRVDLNKSRTALVAHHNARGQQCAGSGYQLPQRSTDALDYRVAGSFEGGRR